MSIIHKQDQLTNIDIHYSYFLLIQLIHENDDAHNYELYNFIFLFLLHTSLLS